MRAALRLCREDWRARTIAPPVKQQAQGTLHEPSPLRCGEAVPIPSSSTTRWRMPCGWHRSRRCSAVKAPPRMAGRRFGQSSWPAASTGSVSRSLTSAGTASQQRSASGARTVPSRPSPIEQRHPLDASHDASDAAASASDLLPTRLGGMPIPT